MIDYKPFYTDIEPIKNEIIAHLYNDGEFIEYIKWLYKNKNINLTLYSSGGGFHYLEYIDMWKKEIGYK